MSGAATGVTSVQTPSRTRQGHAEGEGRTMHTLYNVAQVGLYCCFRILLLLMRIYRSSGRKVTQLKITIFQEKQFNYYIFLIPVFKI
jgi:hypothetical protein